MDAVVSGPTNDLHTCPVCGLIQALPVEGLAAAPHRIARCARCATVLPHEPAAASMAWPAAFSLGALILYPLAMMLPVLRLEKFGHARATTIWSGVVQLINERQVAIGVLVFTCSVIIPLAKILGMFFLCTGDALGGGTNAKRRRATTYRVIDWVSRWGMLDVLLVAILVAAVKLGNWVEVAPGPGIAAFAAVVVLSLLASATFDPRAIWEDRA